VSGLAPPGPVADSSPTGRVVLLGVLLGVLGTALAVGFKLRCGMPADLAGQYLRWCYSDIPPLYFTGGLDVGAVPYLEQPVEYPPLTGLWMWLAALPSATSAAFFGWTSALLVAAGGATGGLLARAVGLRRTLVFAAAPTLWISGAVNWDLPSVALATAGLVAHRRGRDGWAGVWLGLGTAAKLWPALLLPGVVLAAFAARGSRGGWRAVAGAAGAWLVVNLPVALAAPDGWLRFLELNRERPADWDSLWRLGQRWLDVQLSVPTLNLLVGVLTAAGVLALLVLAVRWDPPERWHLVALPVVAWFLLVNKVWSPQFSLWLLPLLALAAPPVWGLVAFALADVAVTLTRFPYLGTVLGLEDAGDAWPFEVAVVVRAVVVAVVAVLAWRRAAAPPGGGQRTQLRLHGGLGQALP
jgi:hypothetical protein